MQQRRRPDPGDSVQSTIVTRVTIVKMLSQSGSELEASLLQLQVYNGGGRQ